CNFRVDAVGCAASCFRKATSSRCRPAAGRGGASAARAVAARPSESAPSRSRATAAGAALLTAAGFPGRGRATLGAMAKAPALPGGFELPLEPRLPRIGSVDAVAVEERAAALAKRSIKRESKLFALELAIRMMDLTTLEGQDTPGKIAALASKAVRPGPTDPTIPSVAALCIYPSLVPHAVAPLRGTGVRAASVATAVPSGQAPTELKVREVEAVVAMGADEVDMVIDRGAF